MLRFFRSNLQCVLTKLWSSVQRSKLEKKLYTKSLAEESTFTSQGQSPSVSFYRFQRVWNFSSLSEPSVIYSRFDFRNIDFIEYIFDTVDVNFF